MHVFAGAAVEFCGPGVIPGSISHSARYDLMQQLTQRGVNVLTVAAEGYMEVDRRHCKRLGSSSEAASWKKTARPSTSVRLLMNFECGDEAQ